MPITKDSQKRRKEKGLDPANKTNHIKKIKGAVKTKDLPKVANAVIAQDIETLKTYVSPDCIAKDLSPLELRQQYSKRFIQKCDNHLDDWFSSLEAKEKSSAMIAAFKESEADLRLVTDKKYDIDIQQIIRCASDPVYFATTLGFTPDVWQKDFLLSKHPQRQLVITRQGGKSTIGALLALHRCIYKPGLTLIIAPSLKQSRLLLDSFKEFYTRAEYKPVATVDNIFSMEFDNSSRIVALPNNKDKIRGYKNVDLLILDEAAWIPKKLYEAIRPMRAVSQGDLVAMSTFNGKLGWFYDAYIDGAAWEKYTITADQCPRISKEFLETEKKEMPIASYLQEYFCIPTETEGGVFTSEDFEAALEAGATEGGWELD